jgi:hypothetical protein
VFSLGAAAMRLQAPSLRALASARSFAFGAQSTKGAEINASYALQWAIVDD